MGMTTPVLSYGGYRFVDDDGSEANATSLALNTSYSLSVDTTCRIRMMIQETAGGAVNNQGFNWQYQHVEGTNTWTTISTSSSVLQAVTSQLVDDADTTSSSNNRIGSGTFITDNNGQCETGSTSTATADFVSNEAEVELSFQIVGNDVSDGDTINIRALVESTVPSGTVATTTAVKTGQTVVPGGIASVEAFGSGQFNMFLPIGSNGIVSSEAFGTNKVNMFLPIGANGIASAEVFGGAKLNLSLRPTGITSTETFGSITILFEQRVQPTGIVSAESVSEPIRVLIGWTWDRDTEDPLLTFDDNIGWTFDGWYEPATGGTQTVIPSTIASAEAFGSHRLGLYLQPTAVDTAEAFGSPRIVRVLSATGIVSNEAFGAAKVNLYVVVPGTGTEEAFGSHTFKNLNTLYPTAIVSSEAHGTTVMVIPPYVLEPTSIASLEAHGNAVLDIQGGPTIIDLLANGIAGGEAFGNATLQPGGVNVSNVGNIATQEAFSTPEIIIEVYTLEPSSIATQEQFGSPRLGMYISASAIVSGEAFGTPKFSADTLLVTGIASEEAFGIPIITGGITSYYGEISSDISRRITTDLSGPKVG
jgi:hypothetical protein